MATTHASVASRASAVMEPMDVVITVHLRAHRVRRRVQARATCIFVRIASWQRPARRGDGAPSGGSFTTKKVANCRVQCPASIKLGDLARAGRGVTALARGGAAR